MYIYITKISVDSYISIACIIIHFSSLIVYCYIVFQ